MQLSRYTTRFAVALICLLCIACTTACAGAVRVTERMPEGSYCGEYTHDLVTGKLTLQKEVNIAQVHLKGFGSEVDCPNEPYSYDPKTHHAVLLTVDDPADCIGSLLRQNHLSLNITYNPSKDIVKLDLGITHIDCKKCK